ncbi:hypothetical protein [Dethiothermospora halolimnae]|uniref:hypothetical protein n=1 Tax=Dethiothermospora halolimnae TaxID=3114390 RepID=UPI003CCB8CBF
MIKTIRIHENEVKKIFNNESWDALDDLDFRNISVIFNTFGGSLNSDFFEFDVELNENHEFNDKDLKNMILKDLEDLHCNLS